MNFINKTAISTGAASGMGLLMAQNWAGFGGNIVMCDVNKEMLLEKVDAINAQNKGRAVGVVCDVRDYRQVENACKTAHDTFGSIDLVCNFAGGQLHAYWVHVGNTKSFRMCPLTYLTGA